MTNNLFQRMMQHKAGIGSKFASRYNLEYLVYYQSFDDIALAIAEEKRIKNRNRKWKEDLIDSINPMWKDLSKDWMDSDWYLEHLIN